MDCSGTGRQDIATRIKHFGTIPSPNQEKIAKKVCLLVITCLRVVVNKDPSHYYLDLTLFHDDPSSDYKATGLLPQLSVWGSLHSTGFQISLQTSLDFTHHKQTNLINKLYFKEQKISDWRIACSCTEYWSSRIAGIHFAIEFTWHVPRLLIWILSITSGSRRGQSVCLTDVNSFLLSLPLSCSVVSDIISADTEQESSYINMRRRLVACALSSEYYHFYAALNAPSLTQRKSVSRADLWKIMQVWIIKEGDFLDCIFTFSVLVCNIYNLC